VVVIVVIVVVIAVGTSNSPSHSPSADVKITSCAVDSTTRLPTARVEIHNHTSKASTYGVTVEFDAPKRDSCVRGRGTVVDGCVGPYGEDLGRRLGPSHAERDVQGDEGEPDRGLTWDEASGRTQVRRRGM